MYRGSLDSDSSFFSLPCCAPTLLACLLAGICVSLTVERISSIFFAIFLPMPLMACASFPDVIAVGWLLSALAALKYAEACFVEFDG